MIRFCKTCGKASAFLPASCSICRPQRRLSHINFYVNKDDIKFLLIGFGAAILVVALFYVVTALIL